MDALLRRRIMMMAGGTPTPPPPPPLPYDAEVEYLESSGTQVINTGIAVSKIRKYQTYMRMNVTSTAQAEGSTHTQKYYFVGQNASKKLYAALVKTVKATTITNDGGWHTLVLDLTNGKYTIDGVDTTVTTGTINSSIKFALFACNGVSSMEGSYAYYISGKKGRTTIYGDNDEVLADFIPVRVGQIGYMYDNISQNLFGNVGSGSFTIGPDVN